MSRIGISLCLGVVSLSLTDGRAAEKTAGPPSAVAVSLAVQDAMRQGREFLQQGKPKAFDEEVCEETNPSMRPTG